LILIAFLVIALVLPWDNQVVEIERTHGKPNVDGRLVGAWTWRGLILGVSPANKASSLGQVSRSQLVEWDKLPSDTHGSHARRVYISSMFFTLMALLSSVMLFIVLVFGLIVRRTSAGCSHLFQGRPKWAAVAIGLIIFVFTAVAWGLFMRFPRALDNDGLCADVLFDVEDELWCASHSLAGSQSLHNVPFKLVWQNSNTTVPVDAHFAWAPSVGWIFCVVSSGLVLLCMVFIGLINTTKREDPLGWEYRVVRETEIALP